MTVLHLWHSSDWRGGENQFLLLAKYLREPWRGRLGAPAGSELARRLDGLLPIHTLRCGGFLDAKSILAARRMIRAHGIRLIHAHDSHGLATALATRIGLGVPVIMSRRNAFPISSGLKYRAADKIIAVSAAAASHLSAAGIPPARIAVVPDAVDFAGLVAAAPKRLDALPDELVVLCVAAFSSEKDHQTLLEAWFRVERAVPRARLHLAGNGPLENKIRELVAALGLRNVHFIGWRNDVPNLIRGADLAVLSSRSEGLGSSLCEAQAAGKVVAATRAGGIVEAVEDGRTGLLSPPGDAAALAASIVALLNDADRRREMGEAAAVRARSLFAPDSIARRHEALYELLLSC